MADAYGSITRIENTRGEISGIFQFKDWLVSLLRMWEHRWKIVKLLDMHRMMKFVNFGRIKSVLNNIFSIIYKNQRSIDFHWLNKVHLLISIISLLMPWLFHPQLHSILPVKLSIAISIKSAKIWHFYIEIKFNLSSFFHSLLILSHALFLKQIFFFSCLPK